MTLTQSQLTAAWAPRCTGPFLKIALHGSGVVSVRPAIGDATLALDACLRAHDYETRRADTGAYNCRPKTSGNGWSLHAYAISIDINWLTNPYGPRLITDMSPAMIAAILAIRTRSGHQVWTWGGHWSGNKDAMHFEIACSPAAIASGIDPATVPGAAPPPYIPPAQPAAIRPATPPEEDPVAYIRVKETGAVYSITSEHFRHLGPKAWDSRVKAGATSRDVSAEEAMRWIDTHQLLQLPPSG